MAAPDRALIQGWLDDVIGRRGGMCGIFIGPVDGHPYQHRARPWDEPDLLKAGSLNSEGLRLEADGADGPLSLTLEQIDQVYPDEHPWGPAVHLSAVIGGDRQEVWLV
ncbi:MAG: hypothetical protein ACKOE2_05265 [Actinomycetales bacterium]